MALKKILFIVVTSMALLAGGAVLSWGMIASNTSRAAVLSMTDDDDIILVGLSLAHESGEMRYTIQGEQDGGWKSELIWPLDGILYVGGTASVNVFRRLHVSAGIWKSVETDTDAGTMEDSDWFYGVYGNHRVIYSETDATLNSSYFDVNIRYDLFSTHVLSLGAMLGYNYQKWDWQAGGGYQTSLDPGHFYVGPLPEESITYEEKIQAFYLGAALSGAVLLESLGFNLYALYTPFAICDDVDDHLLRYKRSTGQTDGPFFSAGGDLSWNFANSWSLLTQFNYTKYDFEGEQEQYFYGGNNPPVGTRYSGIELDVEGSQSYLGFMLSYEL